MNEDQFFEGFVAALRLRGLDYIDARHDRHHKRFARVIEALRECRAARDAGALEMPSYLVPSPITDRFPELDDALLNQQLGRTGSQNPFYPGVELTLSAESAERDLESFSPDERATFARLAEVFAKPLDEEAVIP